MTRRLQILAALAIVILAGPLSACPFCSSQGKTLLGEVVQAHMILFGNMTNAKLNPGSFDSGSTEFVIEKVVKEHPILNGRKSLTIPRYIPLDDKSKFLLFCEVFNGKIDPYRGMAVALDSPIADYLIGAMAVKDKPDADKLRYFYKYLDSADNDVANDALTEFGNTDYPAFRAMAKDISPEKVIAWLKHPNTAPIRFGLYGSMLGHCGKPEHADILRRLLDDPKKRFTTGMDGVLAGYAMLDPKAGYAYLCDVLKDPKKEFLYRYAALRAIRFFWEFRPDVLSAQQLVDAVLPMLDQPDMADFPMDDLRKWKRFELSGRILPLYTQKSHQSAIVKRAIVRYALSCPTTDRAAVTFLEQARAHDAAYVREIEDLLWLEQAPVVK